MNEDAEPVNVMNDPVSYESFYDELGKEYPETETVHSIRGIGSRYWTILDELRPFAVSRKRLIDIGCNDGVYTIPYCQMGGEGLGVDISSSLVEKAMSKAESLGLSCSFVQAEIDSPSFPEKINQAFDIVLCSEVDFVNLSARSK